MVAGVNTLCDAVKSTMGPGGNITWLDKGPHMFPEPTMDGRTVADHAAILMDDQYAIMGAKIASGIARQTDSIGGDGTTTSLVISQGLLNEGLRHMEEGIHPNEIERGVSIATSYVLEKLAEMAIPVKGRKDIERIATISAHGDTLVGRVVADAVERFGPDGAINIADALDEETSITVIDGAQFPGGMVDPSFANHQRTNRCVLDNPLVLVTSVDITSHKMIHPALSIAAMANRPLLVVCRSIGKDAITMMLSNKGAVASCAVLSPMRGRSTVETLEDVAVATGATMVSDSVGVAIENIDISVMGSAKSAVVSVNDIVIVEGGGDARHVSDRVQNLRDQMKSDPNEAERLKERIRILSGGVAVIRAGGYTKAEVDERKARIVDALNAARASVVSGVLPGGGVALARISMGMGEADPSLERGVAAGWDVVRSAIREPFMAILLNAGHSPSQRLGEISRMGPRFGFDVVSGEVVDMIDKGIIDPCKVTSAAMRNASSVIPLILRTGCATLHQPQ